MSLKKDLMDVVKEAKENAPYVEGSDPGDGFLDHCTMAEITQFIFDNPNCHLEGVSPRVMTIKLHGKEVYFIMTKDGETTCTRLMVA